MSDHSLELQKSIFNALDGDSTLQNLVTDVYDFVPENTAFPYVKVGEETSLDNGTKTLKVMNILLSFILFQGIEEVRKLKKLRAEFMLCYMRVV